MRPHTPPSLKRKKPLKYRLQKYRWEVLIPFIFFISYILFIIMCM